MAVGRLVVARRGGGFGWLLWHGRHRRVPGIWPFRGVVVGSAFYVVAEGLSLANRDPGQRFLLSVLSFLSGGLIAPCIALLFAELTGWTRWTGPRWRAVLLVCGLLIGGGRVLDPWLGWMFVEDGFELRGGMTLLTFTANWGDAAMIGMCGASAGFCLVATGRTWREASRLQRRQLVPLAPACALPMATKSLFNLQPGWMGWFDPTTFMLGATVALMAWAVCRSGFAEVAPIARAFVLEGPDFEWSSFEEALGATLVQLESRLGLACELTVSPQFPALAAEPARDVLRIARGRGECVAPRARGPGVGRSHANGWGGYGDRHRLQ